MRFDSLNEIRGWKMIQRFHHMLCVMARQRGQLANEAAAYLYTGAIYYNNICPCCIVPFESLRHRHEMCRKKSLKQLVQS
jgi:hypothetical protein